MFEIKKALPSSGIFWNLLKEEKHSLIQELKIMGYKVTNELTNNVAWYSGGYISGIKKSSNNIPYNFNDYFEKTTITNFNIFN